MLPSPSCPVSVLPIQVRVKRVFHDGCFPPSSPRHWSLGPAPALRFLPRHPAPSSHPRDPDGAPRPGWRGWRAGRRARKPRPAPGRGNPAAPPGPGPGSAAVCPPVRKSLCPRACHPAVVRAPSGGGGGGAPRMFSFIYCLLFLQIQASAAPSGSRGFTLKVSSCVFLFSAPSPAPRLFSSSVSPSCRPLPTRPALASVGRGSVHRALRVPMVTVLGVGTGTQVRHRTGVHLCDGQGEPPGRWTPASDPIEVGSWGSSGGRT